MLGPGMFQILAHRFSEAQQKSGLAGLFYSFSSFSARAA
jgi:hypothetical protein